MAAAGLSPRDRFAAAVADDDPPLDVACAWLAAEEDPSVDGDDLLAQLDVIAEGLWVPPESAAVEQIARLNHHLFTTWGFDGARDDYHTPSSSFLSDVIERRRGVPILLSIVMIEVARRTGIALDGVGFPGHFLVAPTKAEPRFWVDPFNTGRILTRAQLTERLTRMAGGDLARLGNVDRYLRAVPNRYTLIRVNNNLKGAWLRQEDVGGALRAVERLLLLDDDLLDERRDRGLMLAHLGRPADAVVDLELYLERWPDAPDRERIEATIVELRSA